MLNLGKVVRSDIKPGLHFKLPLVEEVRKFDRRILTLDDAPERYLTSEKKDVSVDFFVKWRIDDVSTFYRAASGGNEDAAKLRLTPIIKDALRNEINRLHPAGSGVRRPRRPDRSACWRRPTTARPRWASRSSTSASSASTCPRTAPILSSVFERMRAERTRVANQLRAEGSERLRRRSARKPSASAR